MVVYTDQYFIFLKLIVNLSLTGKYDLFYSVFHIKIKQLPISRLCILSVL